MIIVKVYGAFHPVSRDCYDALNAAGADAIGHEDAWLFYEDGMLRFSFEGLYFPLEDVLEALRLTLPKEAEGKLDYLDLEAWTLTRHQLTLGAVFNVSTRSLNNILDYAGH